MKGVIIKTFYPRALKTCNLFIYIYIFRNPVFEFGRYCFVFNFWFILPNKSLLHFFWLNYYFSWDFNHHWKINYFWNSKAFKNYNPSFKSKTLHSPFFRNIFVIDSKKFFSSCLLLLCKNCTHVILMVSLHKSTHFIP